MTFAKFDRPPQSFDKTLAAGGLKKMMELNWRTCPSMCFSFQAVRPHIPLIKFRAGLPPGATRKFGSTRKKIRTRGWLQSPYKWVECKKKKKKKKKKKGKQQMVCGFQRESGGFLICIGIACHQRFRKLPIPTDQRLQKTTAHSCITKFGNVHLNLNHPL